MEIFIHQRDEYGNLVSGLHEFDAEVVEQGTNLSIPIADLHFEEVVSGIQLFSFKVFEPGNFLLTIYDVDQNVTISSMPINYTVFVGYCDASSSVVNGSGLPHSVVGEMAKFSVYLQDMYEYPSPVYLEMFRVEICRDDDLLVVSPTIDAHLPNETSASPGLFNYGVPHQNGFVPSPLLEENSDVRVSEFNITYIPTKSGNYNINVFCGNVLLNDGKSFKMTSMAGKVNISLSRIVGISPKVSKMAENDITILLVDSFNNTVPSLESKIEATISSGSGSFLTILGFKGTKDGCYNSNYVIKEGGTYNVCVTFDGMPLEPSPFTVNAYSSEYFPKACNDLISVWEDESTDFDVVENDDLANKDAVTVDFSYPSYGSLLKYGQLFRYTPFRKFYGNDSFSYTIKDINGNLATGVVNISVLIAPPQLVLFPFLMQATEDVLSPRSGGFEGFWMKYSDVMENISVVLSAESGTIFLSPMLMQVWNPLWDEFSVGRNEEAKALLLAGPVEVINFVLQSIQYLGDDNFCGSDMLRVLTTNRNGMNDLNVSIFVDPVNDPPFIQMPEFIILKDSSRDGTLIFDKDRDKFEFFVGDPDSANFPRSGSLFLVTFSLEVSQGVLTTNLPVHLLNSTELKQKGSYRWRPLQTFVTISEHFMVRAKGIRFQATFRDCNDILQSLVYHEGEHGGVLTVKVNDMGNHGCYPTANTNSTTPLSTQASVYLIRRGPTNILVNHALGTTVVVELILVVSLGLILFFFICKCVFVLLVERRRYQQQNSNVDPSPPNISHLEGNCIVRRMSSGYQKLIEMGTKIVAVGRNYASHAKELGNSVPKEPVLFIKPTTSYLRDGGKIEIPEPLNSLDHEVELAVVISHKARDVPEASAMDYVAGYAVALDMTAREIQSCAKSAGLPWTVSKGRDTFTPISSVISKSEVPDPHKLELWLKVDGELKQKGCTEDMIFKIPFLISYISFIMTLVRGDVILTGTPEGVGPVREGQNITAGVTGIVDASFEVGSRKKTYTS